MPELNVAAEGVVLPGDALDQLAAMGVEVHGADGAQVYLKADDVPQPVSVLVHARPGMPDAAQIEAIRGAEQPILVTATHVSTRLARQLRAADINYVDVAGNCSIRLPGLFVEVSGRPRRMPAAQRSKGPAGTRSGLRVLLTLLTDPEGAGTRTIRDVAAGSGVSVGSAQTVLADLRSQGLLHDVGLDRTSRVFEAWLAGYLNDRSLSATKARFEHERGWFGPQSVESAMRDSGCVLGGEDAAEALGLPLRGISGILYSPVPPTAVVRAARLRRADAGTLEWRERWWRPEEGAITAPTPLIYADLIASEDPRLAEVAAELRRTDALLRRLDAN